MDQPTPMDTTEGGNNAVLEEFLQDVEDLDDDSNNSHDNPMNMSVDNTSQDGGGGNGLDVDTIMNMMSVPPQQQGQRQQHQESQHQLDCYPYTFSPLLLFTSNGYFDKGYSNYNAVAQFFRPVLQQVQQQQQQSQQQQGEQGSESSPNVDMLHNVIYERKNMLYEDLLNHIIQHEVRLTETKIRKNLLLDFPSVFWLLPVVQFCFLWCCQMSSFLSVIVGGGSQQKTSIHSYYTRPFMFYNH